ncbi:hypothetical protein BDV18DRAFT_159597 [Aspergillus unguis]
MASSLTPTSPPTSMGSLSSLPAEVRLMIYEQSLKAGTLPSLMRTSRAIHDEIKPRLYDVVDIHITPDARSPYMEISFKHLSSSPSSSRTWTIVDETVAQERNGILTRLPYNKFTSTRLNLYAFDPANRGQLLYLLSKVDELIHVLRRHRDLSAFKYIFNFVPYKGHTWATAQQLAMAEGHALFLRDPFPAFPFLLSRMSPRWDVDFFAILFTKLSSKKRPVRLSDGSSHEVDRINESMAIWFHLELDRAKGREAGILKTRRMSTRVLSYVVKGGSWPWTDSLEFMGKTGKPLPRVMRELLNIDKGFHLTG